VLGLCVIDSRDLPRPSSEGTKVGGFPEVMIDRKILYHGSGISGITEFKAAEETTVGTGFYLTSEEEKGKGYAKRRSMRSSEAKPTVYETEISNMRLADLREPETLPILAQLLKVEVEELLKNPDAPYYVQGNNLQLLAKIRQGKYRSLKDLTGNHSDVTTKIMRKLGYDGLIAIEGGEGEEIGNHDTYLIFDPSRVKILREI
jgi:hypothetical protein